MSYLLMEAECILGVDAIIHVASPLANTAGPQVILDVRGPHTRLVHIVVFSLISRKLCVGCCLRYHLHP